MGAPAVKQIVIPKNAVAITTGGGRGGPQIVGYRVGDKTYDAKMNPTNAAAKTAAAEVAKAQAAYRALHPIKIDDGGGLFGGISSALTQFVQDPSKAVTNVLQPVEKAVTAVASNPQALIAIAAAAAAPYAAASLAPYLTAFGSYSGLAAETITNITIQVAQGVPIEKATENALTNAAVSGASSAVQQKLGKFVTNPGVSNAIKSTVSSGLNTAVKGGSQADVEKAMTAGLVSSGASTAYKEAIDASSPVVSRAVGGAAGGAVTGGTQGAVTGALTEAAGALGSKLAPSPTPPPKTPVAQAEPKNVAELLAAVDAAQKKDYISSSTAFAGAGLIPAAAEETAVLLARLAATPSGQQVLREAATTSDKIRAAIVASGILSAGALTGFIGGQSLVPQTQTGGSTRNPAFDLIPTKGGDPGTATQARQTFAQTDPRRVDISTPSSGDVPVKVETQRVAQILNIPLADAVKLENVNPVIYNFFANADPKSFTPADMETMSSTNQRILESILAGKNINEGSLPDTSKYTTTVQSSPVAELYSSTMPNQSQAETERLARQGQPTTISPQGTAQAPVESATVMQVNSKTGEAIAIKNTGEIFTVKVDPSTKSGTSIKVSASIAPKTAPAPSPAPSPVTRPSPSPSPSPAPKPSPVPAPKPSPVPEPALAPKPVPAPSPAQEPIAPPPSGLVPSPISEKDKQVIELTKPPSTPPLTKEQVASGEYFYNAPGGLAKDEGVTPKQPVYDYDPKAEVPPDVFIKTVLSPKTGVSSALSSALGTTGLAAYRGAGEVEVGTGKARRKVWNEESLKLKDALGV